MRATEEIIAAIPQHDTDDNMLEVALVEDDDREIVELRSVTWANDLGWYRQRTLTLDAASLLALSKSLEKLEKRLGESRRDQRRDNILRFPTGQQKQRNAGNRHAADERSKASR